MTERGEIQILETADDIQERREQVLNRYQTFKELAKERRQKLEEARQFQFFKRDADELETWILEKLQTASDESYKDPVNLQVRFLHRDPIYFLGGGGGPVQNCHQFSWKWMIGGMGLDITHANYKL